MRLRKEQPTGRFDVARNKKRPATPPLFFDGRLQDRAVIPKPRAVGRRPRSARGFRQCGPIFGKVAAKQGRTIKVFGRVQTEGPGTIG